MNHAGIQYGQPSMSSHQQHQQQQQYNHPEITVAAGVSTTATLRQWRKREAEKPSIPENGSEAQGPIARVAPHAHYPRSSDIFTYPQYPEYGNLQYKEMSPTPVKYSEIVEPSGGHHLGHQAMPKSKELLEMCTMQQNQLKQYPHLQMMQNHYGLNQKESHQYLQKEQTGFPPYLPGYKLPNQYPRQYPNEFQIPLYNQDRLQEPSLYQNPGFLYQNRTMYRNYHRPQQVPQQYPNYNYKPNEPYRLHPYPQKFPQMPHIESVPGTISTRKMYQESLYRQNYNCNQLEYAQHYQNRMKVHQDYQETKLFPSPTQMPDVVPENSKSSLKQYLETWNDEPENPDDEKRTENLYIIDSTEIPTESIQQYIHLQVDKLPENIKGFISGSVIKDVGSSVIKTKGTSSPQISVISETKKFVDPKNQPEEQNTVIVYNNPEERKKEEEGFSILGQQLRKTPKPQNYQNEKPQENSTILVPDKFGIPRNTSKLTLEEIPPSCMQQNIPPKTVQRENIPRNISSPEGITSLSPQEISRLEPIEKYIDQNLKGSEIGDVPKPEEGEKIVPKPDSEDKPRSLGLIEESVSKPEEDSCPENVIKSLDFAENPKIEDASRNKVVGENTKIAADFEEEFTQAIDLVIKSKEPKVPKFPDKFAEENKTEEEYCANGTKRKTSFGHIFGSLLGETKEDSKEILKQTVPSHPDCDLVCDLQHSKIMNPSIEEFNGALEELKVSLNCSSKVDVCGRSDEDLDEILIGTLDKTIENGDKGISADKNVKICEDLEEIHVEDSVVDTTILGETSMDIDEMSVENVEDSTECDSEDKSVKIVEDNAMNLEELPVVNSEDVKIEDSNVNIAKMQDDIIKEFENNEEFEDSNLRKFEDTEDICNEIVKEEEVEEKVDCDEISIEIDEEKVTKFEPTQEPSVIEESADSLLKEEKKCVNEDNLPEEVDCENQEVIETKTEEVFIEESPEIKTEETSFEETTIKDEVSLKCEEINISKMEEEDDSPSRKSEDSLNEDIQMNEETKPLNLFEEFSLVEKKSEIDDSAQIELKSSQDFEENEISGCDQVEIKEESLKFEEIAGEISKDSSKKLMEELEENKDKGARTEIDNVEELFAQVIEENVQNSNLIEESSSKEDHLHEETPVVKQTEVEDNPKSLLLDAASQTCPNLSKPVQNISVQTLFATQEVATSTEDFLQIPTVIPEPPPVPKNFDHKFIQTVLTLEDKPTQTTNSNASKSIQTLTDISTKTTQTEDPKPTDFTNLTTEENRILLQIAGELLEINVITTQGKKFISIVPYTDCTIISETNNNIIEDPSREEPEEFAFGPAEEVVFEEQVNEIEIGIEEEVVSKNEEEVKSESEEVVSRNEDEVVKTEVKEEVGVREIGEKVVEEIAEEEESLQGFDSLEKNGDGIEDSKAFVEEIEKKSIVMEEFKVTVTGVPAESLLETNKFEAEKIEEMSENSHVNEEEAKQLDEMKIEDIVCKETEGIEKMEEHIFEDKGVEIKNVGMEVNRVSSEIEEPKMVKETSMENIAEEIRKIREEIDSVKKSNEFVEESKVEGDKKEEKTCKESARNDENKKNGNIVKTVVEDKKKRVSKSSDKKRERSTKTIAKKSEDVSRKRFKKTEDSVKESSSITNKVSVKENISTLETSKPKFVSTKHNFSIIPKRDSPIKKFPNTNKKLASLAQLSPPQTNPPPPKVKTKAELKETPRIIPTQKLQKQVKKIAPMPSPKPLPKKKRLSLEEYKRKRTNSDRSPGKSPKKINIDHDAEIFSKKEFEEPQWQTLSLNESWDKLDKHFGLPPIRKQTTDPGFGTNVESLMEMKVEIDQFCEKNKRNVDPRRKTDVIAIKSKIVEKAEAVVKVEDVENKSIPAVIKENSTAKLKEETVSKERYTEDSHRQECDAWAKKISSSIEDIFTQTFRKDKQRPAYKKLNFDLDSLNPLRPQTIQSPHPKKMQNLIDLNELLPTVKQVKTEETNENSSMGFRRVESKFRGGWEKEDVKVKPLEGRVSVIRESGPKFGEEFKKVVGEERKKDACKKVQRHRRSTVSSEELREAKLPDHQGESVKNQEKLVGNSDFVIEGNPRCSTAFSREVGDGKPAVHRGESLENQKYFSTKKPSEVPMKNVDVKSTVEETLITKENSSRRKGEEIGKKKNQEVQGSDPKDEGVLATVRTNEEVKNSAISNMANEEVGGNIKASEGRSTMLSNEEFKGSVQNTDVGCCRMLSNEVVEGSVKTSDLRSYKTLSAEVEGCVRTNEVSYGMLPKEEVEDVVKTIAVGGCRMLSIEEVKGGEVGSLLVNKEVKTNEVRRYRRGSRSGLKKGSSVESLEGFEVKDLPRLVRFKEGDRRCEVVEEMPVLSPQNVIKISRRLSIDDISKKLMDSKTEASYVRCNSEDLKLHLKKIPEAENLKLHIKLSPKTSGGKLEGVEKKVSKKSTKRSRKRFRNLHADEEIEGYSVFETQNQTGLPKLIIKRNTCENRENGLQPFVRIQRDPDLDILAKKKKKYF